MKFIFRLIPLFVSLSVALWSTVMFANWPRLLIVVALIGALFLILYKFRPDILRNFKKILDGGSSRKNGK